MPECSPGVNSGLFDSFLLPNLLISFFFQLLSSCPLKSCAPDFLRWGIILFWNGWPPALTLEAQPMSIYNSQFYSKASEVPRAFQASAQ